MSDWKSIDTAPYQEVVWVRNSMMEEPVKATRGYVSNGMVCEDQNLFTSAYTPNKYFPTPPGLLICPEEWKELDECKDEKNNDS